MPPTVHAAAGSLALQRRPELTILAEALHHFAQRTPVLECKLAEHNKLAQELQLVHRASLASAPHEMLNSSLHDACRVCAWTGWRARPASLHHRRQPRATHIGARAAAFRAGCKRDVQTTACGMLCNEHLGYNRRQHINLFTTRRSLANAPVLHPVCANVSAKTCSP